MSNGSQVLKSRDDHSLLSLYRIAPEPNAQFQLAENQDCSWVDSNDRVIAQQTLRRRVEPWLTALVQSEHLALLVGSGLTHAVHGIASTADLPGMNPVTFRIRDDEISKEAARIATAAGRENGNIEDRFRAAAELLRGWEIVPPTDAVNELSGVAQVRALRRELTDAYASFTNSILKAEQNLVQADSESRDQAFNYLVSFLMSFASRTGTRERLRIFTTNYDRYIEAAADVAGLRIIDRFVGALTPVFRASRLDVDLHYNPPGIRGEPRYLEGVAHFAKLHGSIDWVDVGGAIRRIGLPFGAPHMKPYLDTLGSNPGDALNVMIYPNAAKDRETTFYPYVELFRDFAAAICRPNSTLICYGYGFGDDHINRVIEDMLTIPSTHLVIIAYGDPLSTIMRLYNRVGRHAQFTMLIGDHFGSLRPLVDHYLPKPAIDRTTVRMTELLKARWHLVPRPDEAQRGDNQTQGEGTT